jgi:hypothetical protein
MNMKKSDYISKGSIIFATLFVVFAILCIMESKYAINITNQGIDTIAPANLKSAPELFRLNLRVESGDFPVEEMTKTKSWGELQKTVSGYAERLELLEKQNRRRSLWASLLYFISAMGMAAFSVLVRKR